MKGLGPNPGGVNSHNELKQVKQSGTSGWSGLEQDGNKKPMPKCSPSGLKMNRNKK